MQNAIGELIVMATIVFVIASPFIGIFVGLKYGRRIYMHGQKRRMETAVLQHINRMSAFDEVVEKLRRKGQL